MSDELDTPRDHTSWPFETPAIESHPGEVKEWQHANPYETAGWYGDAIAPYAPYHHRADAQPIGLRWLFASSEPHRMHTGGWS